MRKTTRTRPDPARPTRGNFTPRGHDAPAADAPGTSAPPPGDGPAPGKRHLRTRLTAVALLPVVAALAAGGFGLDNAARQWRQSDTTARNAVVADDAAAYGRALLDERDLTAAPLLAGDSSAPSVTAARAATDAAARRFGAGVARMSGAPAARGPLAAFRTVEPGLAAVRARAYTAGLPGVGTQEAYAAVERPLADLAAALEPGGGALDALSRAREAESTTRSVGTQLLVEGHVPAARRRSQLTALSSYAYLERAALADYRAATGGQGATPPAVPPARAAALREIASGAPVSALAAHDITPAAWEASATSSFDTYATLVTRLTGQDRRAAATDASDARRRAAVDAALLLAGVLGAVLVSWLAARSIERGVRRLRSGALEAARRLPELVDGLTRGHRDHADDGDRLLPVGFGGEIGDVARAFDEVRGETLRLAAEQARLRGGLAGVLAGAGHRNQALVERQLSLIGDLAGTEADPDRARDLLRLDRLAARVRRHGESLLVLSGQEADPRWRRPVPLADVLRAAAEEAEGDGQVRTADVPPVSVRGAVAADLVHLLAELMDNAVSYSSPRTGVDITAIRLPDRRVVVEVHDQGIGLSARDFATINHALAEPFAADPVASGRTGLPVVGRLAARHGLHVRLRPRGERAGTTAMVTLPAPVVEELGAEEPEEGLTVSRIVAGHGEPAVLEAEPAVLPGPVDSGAGALDGVRTAGALDGVRIPLALGPAARREGPGTAPGAVAEVSEPSGRGEPLFGGDNAIDGRYQQSYDHSYDNPPPLRPRSPRPLPRRARPGTPDELITPADQGRSEPEYVPSGDLREPLRREPDGPPPEPPEAGAVPGPLPEWPKRVGYDAPIADPGGARDRTEAGLPRRDPRRSRLGAATGEEQLARERVAQEQGGHDNTADGRSTYDELRHRAEPVREPTAAGTTPSGLPRRVPRANLVPGTAQRTEHSGPLVSRSPGDVRGRLSDLRRGVRQGRGAGTTPSPTDSQGPGPNHQER